MDKEEDIINSSHMSDFQQEEDMISCSSTENEEIGDTFVDFQGKKSVNSDRPPSPEDKIPKLKMTFASEEDAYVFYNEYARLCGFGIRRSTKHRMNKNLYYRTFCCACEGLKKPDKRDVNVKSPRPETRTGCGARMTVSSRLTASGKFEVNEFVADHKGHEMLKPEQVHMLRSHRKITPLQATQVDSIDNSRIAPKAGMHYMAEQAGGRENIGYILEDLKKNYLRSKRTLPMKDGDAGGLLNYLELKQSKDPNFVNDIQLDVDDLITNIFWADGQMRADYAHFGDEVSFDTTHRKNKMGRPFAFFVGVNHHKQTIIFGVALLYDESAKTFMWLYDAFVQAMGGKKPETVLTDQDAAMAKALKEKWKETTHRLCIWHIYQNVAIHLSTEFAKFPKLSKEFNSCIYDHEDEEDFIDAWQKMLAKYDLESNSWLESIFKVKEKWAMVYGRQTFCADMISTQRSESMHSVLKKYVNIKQNLIQFCHHLDRLIDDRRYEEVKADLRTIHSTPKLPFSVRILKHARTVYTFEVFNAFQEQLSTGLDTDFEVVEESGSKSVYKVRALEKRFSHTVTYHTSDVKVSCGCKKFEFAGILCSHALRVLFEKKIVEIPDIYIKKRWTKKAKQVLEEHYSTPNVSTKNTKEKNEKSRIGERSRELARLHMQYISRAAMAEETFEFLKKNISSLSRDIETRLENISLEASLSQKSDSSRSGKSLTSLGQEKQTTTDQHETSLVEDGDDRTILDIKSASHARGLKMKPGSNVKSGKRLKDGLEQAIQKRKPKQNKTSSNNHPDKLVENDQATQKRKPKQNKTSSNKQPDKLIENDQNPIFSSCNPNTFPLARTTYPSLSPLSQVYQNRPAGNLNWVPPRPPLSTPSISPRPPLRTPYLSPRPPYLTQGHTPLHLQQLQLSETTSPYMHQRLGHDLEFIERNQGNTSLTKLLQENMLPQQVFESFPLSNSTSQTKQPNNCGGSGSGSSTHE